MAETKTNLRQASAKAFVTGILSEKNLEIKTEEGMKKISGHLTIKTSDVNFVKFNVMVNEKTKAGNDNKCYVGVQTVINEYQSIADVGEENATRVKVNGELNPFTGRDGKKNMGFKSNFFNRLKTDEEYEPKSEFSIEVFISSITPEITTEGEETGRIVVGGWMPTYNGIEPIELVAEKEIGEQIESSFEPGQTVEFYGIIVNNRIETVTEIPVKIGKPRKKVSVEYKNDMIITGASEPYEKDITSELPYEEETIKAAIQERENKLAGERAKAQGSTKPINDAKPSGAAHGRSLGF